jgi:hypothetical protein
MAASRSKNTPGDYQLEQQAYTRGLAYHSYETSNYYAVPSNTYFPGQGLVGMKAPHRVLSQNYCDVESQLFGIGANNLVAPVSPVQPEIHSMPSLDIHSKPRIFMPDPFLPQTNQRPLYLN